MAGKIDEQAALKAAREFPGLAGMDLAKVVSCDQAVRLERNDVDAGPGLWPAGAAEISCRRVRLRHQAQHPAHARRARLQADGAAGAERPKDALALKPDGVFLSNGPGDPEPCDYAIRAIRELLDTGVPIFGICLGHQLLGLASGAQHREDEIRPSRRQPSGAGSRQRARDDHQPEPRLRGRCRATLPANVRVTHVSLFDGTLQGFARTDRPAFCFQGHPEASPGPHDVDYLFDRFVRLMEKQNKAKRTRGDRGIHSYLHLHLNAVKDCPNAPTSRAS